MDINQVAAQVNEYAGYGQGMEVEDTGGGVMVGRSDVVRGRWAETVVEGGKARMAVRSLDDDGTPEWTYVADASNADEVESAWTSAVAVAHATRCELCDGFADGQADVPGRGMVSICDDCLAATPTQACAVCSAPVHEHGDICDDH